MKIIITGASGFVGQAAVIHFAKEGHEIRAVVRKPDSVSHLPCESAVWDSENQLASDIAPFFEYADVVIHLSGEPFANKRWSRKVKESIRASRVFETRKIVEAIRQLSAESRPKTFICASVIGYYGGLDDEILDESSDPGVGFLTEVVLGCEAEAHRVEALGVRVVHLRIGAVLGRGGGVFQKMKPLILGNGNQRMSWIHIQDVIRFIHFSLKKNEVSGVFNLVAPNPVLRLSENFLNVALPEMSRITLDSTSVRPKRAEQVGFKFQFETLESAMDDIFKGMKGLESRFSVVQFIPKPVEEVFSFFSKAENLEVLTPPWLNFHIVGKSTPEIEEKTLIDYRLKIHGIPVRWQSRIESWKPGIEFVDTQTRGPYAKWHHTHRFEKIPGGTLVFDDVIYQVPGGKLGSVFGESFVRKDIHKIFSYRMNKISEIFQR